MSRPSVKRCILSESPLLVRVYLVSVMTGYSVALALQRLWSMLFLSATKRSWAAGFYFLVSASRWLRMYFGVLTGIGCRRRSYSTPMTRSFLRSCAEDCAALGPLESIPLNRFNKIPYLLVLSEYNNDKFPHNVNSILGSGKSTTNVCLNLRALSKVREIIYDSRWGN